MVHYDACDVQKIIILWYFHILLAITLYIKLELKKIIYAYKTKAIKHEIHPKKYKIYVS